MGWNWLKHNRTDYGTDDPRRIFFVFSMKKSFVSHNSDQLICLLRITCRVPHAQEHLGSRIHPWNSLGIRMWWTRDTIRSQMFLWFFRFVICTIWRLWGSFQILNHGVFFVKNGDFSFRLLSHFFKVSRGSESFSLWRNPGRWSRYKSSCFYITFLELMIPLQECEICLDGDPLPQLE